MRSTISESKIAEQHSLICRTANAVDSTPFHRSLEMAKAYNIPRILIENGADLCNRNIDGETPVHTHFGPVLEQIFLVHSCLLDFTVCDKRGKSLLHHLAWSSKTSLRIFKEASIRSGSINRALTKSRDLCFTMPLREAILQSYGISSSSLS